MDPMRNGSLTSTMEDLLSANGPRIVADLANTTCYLVTYTV
jgi:hypothetical protein